MRAVCLRAFQSRETLTCFLAQGQNGGTLRPLMDTRAPSRARLLVCVFTPEHLFANSPDRSALTPPSAWSYHPIPSPGPDGSPLPRTFLSLSILLEVPLPIQPPAPQVSPQARALPLTVDQPLVASAVPSVKRQIVRQPELLWIQPRGLGPGKIG